jgi:oligopeptidase B
MKDDNWQAVLEDPSLLKEDIAQHLLAENAFYEATLSCSEALKNAMFQEMKGRTKEDMSTAPCRDGPFDYFYRFEAGAEHGMHMRRAVETGLEEILLDEDAASKGKCFYQVGASDYSPDHTHFGWCEFYYRILVSFLPPVQLLLTRPGVLSCFRYWCFILRDQVRG